MSESLGGYRCLSRLKVNVGLSLSSAMNPYRREIIQHSWSYISWFGDAEKNYSDLTKQQSGVNHVRALHHHVHNMMSLFTFCLP